MELGKYQPQYIRSLANEEADIFIFDDIGMGGINGQEFADEIKLLNDFGVNRINVHINSNGGSVMDGFSIFMALVNSKAEIHTINEGVAASIAGIILLAGDKVSMFDFANVMIHNPTGSEDPNEKEKNAINAIRDGLLVILKNRTKKNKTDLSAMMNVETWLNAKQALEAGFVDEIISSKHNDDKKKRNRIPAMEIMNILNHATPSKNDTMKTVLDFLGLNENASESAVLAAVTKIKNNLEKEIKAHEDTQGKLTTSEGIVDKQKEKINKFDEEQATLNEKLVTDTIETAIKDGKVEEKQKDELIAQFKNNVDGLKSVLGALKVTAPSIKDQLSTGDIVDGDIPEDRKGWDLREWEKEDQSGINEIMNNNQELYAKLYKKTYGVELEVA